MEQPAEDHQRPRPGAAARGGAPEGERRAAAAVCAARQRVLRVAAERARLSARGERHARGAAADTARARHRRAQHEDASERDRESRRGAREAAHPRQQVHGAQQRGPRAAVGSAGAARAAPATQPRAANPGSQPVGRVGGVAARVLHDVQVRHSHSYCTVLYVFV